MKLQRVEARCIARGEPYVVWLIQSLPDLRVGDRIDDRHGNTYLVTEVGIPPTVRRFTFGETAPAGSREHGGY